MSLQFKRNTPRDYSNLKVLFEDTSQTSPKFFRVSDVPQVLTKGKNLLRISAHPSNLVPNSQIIVDIKDANGDPIYFEVPDYLENDKSRVISIWIYHDKDDFNTANGDATITIYGIARVDQNGKPVPSRYRGKHNVKWSTTINVDRDRENISPVIFKGDILPTISISESIEVYQNLPSTGSTLQLTTQTGGGARYIYKGRTPIVQLTDGSEFNQEMVEYSLQLGNFEVPATPETRFENPTNITSYTSSIKELIDSTTVILNTPFTTEFDDREDLTHTFTSIESADYSISYFQTSSNIVTENQRSYANLTISNVNPIVGYPNKLRVLIKSDGLPGDYELLNEVTVPFSSSLSVKIPIPSEHLEDPKRIKVQYLNSVGDISRTETITEPYKFEGGNYYFGGRKNLISGSMFISNALGSGIEMGGVSSGFIRSVGYEGITSASLGKGPGGFIIYSGSGNLVVGEDQLEGVGVEFVGDNDDRHFIFTTANGGLLDVKTDKFFIGTSDSQFISGSDGNIEISSSIFHLDPQNNLLIIGADAVINADLTVNSLRTPAIINGAPSTKTNSSSSIDADGFARFVSASIGGFEVSETQINSANDNLILKDSGQITGSNVLFSGGKVAGFEITNTQINSTNNNLILKASGQITASDGFLFGNKGTSQYVQFDDGNLVVRGDLSVDQIFTPATINGSPANITNASSSITSDGFAKFVSASIGGWGITTGSIEGGNLIMKPEGILQTRDFATGVKGWKISSLGNGTAEFENVRIRGTLSTTTFEKESVNAVGGQLYVANSTTISGSFYDEYYPYNTASLHGGTFPAFDVATISIDGSASIDIDTRVDNTTLYLETSSFAISQSYQLHYEVSSSLTDETATLTFGYTDNVNVSGSFDTTAATYVDATTFQIGASSIDSNASDVETFTQIQDTSATGIFTSKGDPVSTADISWELVGTTYTVTLSEGFQLNSVSMSAGNPGTLEFVPITETEYIGSTGVTASSAILNAPIDNSGSVTLSGTGIDGTYDIVSKESDTRFTIDTTLSSSGSIAATDWQIDYINTGSYSTGTVSVVSASQEITGSVSADATTFIVKNATGFVPNEILTAKKVNDTGFATEYMQIVTSSVFDPSGNDFSGTITVVRGYGSSSLAGLNPEDMQFLGDLVSLSQSYEEGQVLASTGVVGTGYIRLNANPRDQSTPYIDIVERTGSGVYDVELKARLGDLSGLANSTYVFGNPSPGFGLATDNVFLQGGIIANTGSIGGINMEAGKLYNGTGTFNNSNTGFYIDSASNFSLGDTLSWNGTSLVVSGSNARIEVDKFFVGSLNTQFISGSTGIIEISSSNFHLKPNGDVVIGGAATIEQGAVFGVLPSLPLNDSLRIYLPFEEGAGTTVFNHAQESQGFTLNGSYQRVSGSVSAYGNGVYLTGGYITSDTNDNPDDIIHDGDSRVTQSLSVWLNTPSASISHAPMIVYEQGGGTSGQILSIKDNFAYWAMYTSNGASSLVVSASINDNDLTHIGTWFEKNVGVRIYKNGILQQESLGSVTAAGSNQIGIGGVNGSARIVTSSADPGINPSTNGEYAYYGMIDELRVYKQTLTAAEFLALYQNPGGVSSTTKITGDNISTGQIKSNNWGTSAGSKLDLDNGIIKLGGSTAPKFAVNAAGALTSSAGTIGGITIEDDKLFTGVGTWGNSNTGFYVDSESSMSLADKLTWDGSTLNITGVINIESGTGFATQADINTATGSLSSSIATSINEFANSIYIDFDDNIGLDTDVWNITGSISTAANLGGITVNKSSGVTWDTLAYTKQKFYRKNNTVFELDFIFNDVSNGQVVIIGPKTTQASDTLLYKDLEYALYVHGVNGTMQIRDYGNTSNIVTLSGVSENTFVRARWTIKPGGGALLNVYTDGDFTTPAMSYDYGTSGTETEYEFGIALAVGTRNPNPTLLQLSAGGGSLSTGQIVSQKIVTDINNKITKPNPAPSSTGLFLASSHMGYYDSSAWNAYISSSGEFLFKADDDNLISFGNSSFILKVADQAVISGSQISLLTPNFFFGGANQFISGANSNIEISSSNFHLSEAGDVTLSGTVTADAGAIGGFGITSTAISSSNDELILKSNGQITGSSAVFISNGKVMLDTDSSISDAANIQRTIPITTVGDEVLFYPNGGEKVIAVIAEVSSTAGDIQLEWRELQDSPSAGYSTATIVSGSWGGGGLGGSPTVGHVVFQVSWSDLITTERRGLLKLSGGATLVGTTGRVSVFTYRNFNPIGFTLLSNVYVAV